MTILSWPVIIYTFEVCHVEIDMIIVVIDSSVWFTRWNDSNTHISVINFPIQFQSLGSLGKLVFYFEGLYRKEWGFTQLDTSGRVGSSGAWHPNRWLKSHLGGEFQQLRRFGWSQARQSSDTLGLHPVSGGCGPHCVSYSRWTALTRSKYYVSNPTASCLSSSGVIRAGHTPNSI